MAKDADCGHKAQDFGHCMNKHCNNWWGHCHAHGLAYPDERCTRR